MKGKNRFKQVLYKVFQVF